MDIFLTNTLTRTKEPIRPHQNNTITMYVCGITPYDAPHLGHGRVYVTFDLITRLFMLLGYEVTYVRNFTDIDDKIIKKSLEEGVDFTVVAERYIEIFQENMRQLNCLSPHAEPRVTEYINNIIDFIQKLLSQGHAYILENDVYFDITSYAAYGKLSQRSSDERAAGARVEVNTQKKNPGDFALWKGNQTNEFWQSPWGFGRPGWHIECSVMAYHLLGKTIDVHGGGMDLIFPHHENEIAQSEACFQEPFARHWIHNAFININQEKMSKSLGNFITLDQLFNSIDPMVVRFYFIQHHYRKPIDFTSGDLTAAATAYHKICALLQPFPAIEMPETGSLTDYPLVQDLLGALCDDLNTPKFLGIFFEHQKEICSSQKLGTLAKYIFQGILGLSLEYSEREHTEIPSEVQALLEERERARQSKDWKRADELRTMIQQLGYDIQDKKLQ